LWAAEGWQGSMKPNGRRIISAVGNAVRKRDDECAASCRAQLAFPSNPFLPLVQMLDLILGLAILTLRKKSNNLVSAERVPTTHGWAIIHNLSDTEVTN
jgi:hypothetical protein